VLARLINIKYITIRAEKVASPVTALQSLPTTEIIMLITARSELRKILFLAPSVCGFCLYMKYLGGTAE